MNMNFRKDKDGLRSIVTSEFDLMVFPEKVHGCLLGTYCDGEMIPFRVSTDLKECSFGNKTPKSMEKNIKELIELFEKTESEFEEESWSKVIER